MNELFKYDRIRNSNGTVLRFLWVIRTAKDGVLLFRIIAKLLYRYYSKKYGLEISYGASIGKGLYLGHAFNITVNPRASIGDFCNLHRGVLIGQENRGLRKGAPHVGNKVWIGTNAVIVGNVTIEDDVLIAPNSFVNCDVPSHSVVFGNPCVIKHKNNATEGYINNVI